MDKLIMNINDYKSINKASIEINKINVVSGVNGSGKSTLSRIFYSFLKGNSTKRIDYLIERTVEEFNKCLDFLNEDFVDYDFPDSFEVTDTLDELMDKFVSLYEISERHEKLCEPKVKELDKKISKEFESCNKKLVNKGIIQDSDVIEFNEGDDYLSKFFELFELIPDSDVDDAFEICQNLIKLGDEKTYFENTPTVNYMLVLSAQPLKKFIENDTYEVSEDCFQSILFKEESKLIHKKSVDFQIELSDHSKTNPYEYFFNNGFIDNIYYFDNVSIFDLINLNMDYKSLIHINEFAGELFEYSDDKNYDESINNILEKIESIVGGKYFNKVPIFITDKMDNSSLRYKRKENVRTTNDTPSGIKQIGILQLLLVNNKLNNGDYLIIDEPEVNLHPDWQFKFAEILVLLSKELNITIYINSHSPLFIESMAAFCEYYDMQEDINYYLTEPSEDGEKYDFVKINSDEIFRVYNNLGNAYDLIDQLRLKKRLGE